MKKEKKTIKEPAKRIEVKNKVDVVVCGGGPAGVTAALAAAKMGMEVVLIESYGFLGGVITAAGVNGIGGWQYDVDGEPLISGLPMEIMKRLANVGGADKQFVDDISSSVNNDDYPPGLNLNVYWIRSNPELLKIVLDKMMEEAGVQLMYHTNAVMPVMEENRVKGVYIESKSGRQAILAKIVIDCTGDGDIAARSGADFQMGRVEDGACQPLSMIYTVGNADISGLFDRHESGKDPLVRNRYQKAVELSRKRREIVLNPNDIFCAATPLNKKYPLIKSVNFTRVQGVDTTDVDQLTEAEIIGRKQVLEGINFMRKYMEGCKDAFLVSIPPHIGIRESRRIKGRYTLTGDDVKNGARFPDGIARGIYTLDIHNPTEIGQPSTLIELEQPYDIPYRSLLPEGIENILVAGRCISGDFVALSSYRIQSHCMAMGEAAGTAAAQAITKQELPGEINVSRLRKQLKENGANPGSDI